MKWDDIEVRFNGCGILFSVTKASDKTVGSSLFAGDEDEDDLFGSKPSATNTTQTKVCTHSLFLSLNSDILIHSLKVQIGKDELDKEGNHLISDGEISSQMRVI